MAQKGQQDSKKSVNGKVEKVVFYDPKTGRSIFSIEQENGRPCSVIGNVDILEEGSTITATGKWRKDEKYGWQFLAEEIQVTSQSEEDMEPIEDGLMHALDFSNVLNKRLKGFRDIVLDYKYDEEEYDFGYLSETVETIKVANDKKKAEEEKKHKELEKKNKGPEKKDPKIEPADGAIYNKEMTKLISGPKNQASFIIPSQVTCIGGGAFSDSRLESVIIPDSVRSIRNGAFSDCKQLTAINIPSSVEHIGDLAFAGCQKLMSINVDKGNKEFCDFDGVLYSHDLSQVLSVPNGLAVVRIHDSATTIKTGAFHGCNKLTELYIPSSVVNISQHEFGPCSKLETIAIPDVVANEGISYYCDSNKPTSVTFSGSITHLGVTTLNWQNSLQTIVIPASVQSIEEKAFLDCPLLKEIIVEEGNSHFRSIDGVLYDYDVSRIVWVPRGKKSVTIPESVTNIDNCAFNWCQELSSITIPDSVTSIGDKAFMGCGMLSKIIIPSSVNCLGDCAFQGCSSLETIAIPNSVAKIGSKAFHGCTGLRSVQIADLTKWCSIEFAHPQSSSLYAKESDFSANPLVYAMQLELNGNVLKDLVIPDGISAIKDIAFFNCKSLEHVTFTRDVTEIGKLAFFGCSNLIVGIPDTVSKFGIDAFKGCKSYILNKTVDIDWKDVTFLENRIRVPNQIGGWTEIEDKNIDSTVNTMRKHLEKRIPFLTVHYERNATLVNAKELHDAVITLKIKNDLSALIREGYQPAEILKRIDGLSEKYIRELIPHDMTPYINFLLEKHAADKYPLVPIEEYIGGRLEDGEYVGGHRENGALYTIMIDGQPNIVWENNKDSRSTYVFSCTEEDYEDTRQLVFDYIMAEGNGKRKLLHTDKCLTIFKEQPRMIVHNGLRSWAARLLQVDNDEIEVKDDVEDKMNAIFSMLSKEDLKKLSKAIIHMEYELDPELHFYDDEMWDDNGVSVELYYAGERSLSRERTYKVSKRLIAEALAEHEIKDIEEAYELICEYVVGYLGDELDEVSDGVDVNIEIDGEIIYNTSVDS